MGAGKADSWDRVAKLQCRIRQQQKQRQLCKQDLDLQLSLISILQIKYIKFYKFFIKYIQFETKFLYRSWSLFFQVADMNCRTRSRMLHRGNSSFLVSFFHIQYTAQILKLIKIHLKLLLKLLHAYFAEDNNKVPRHLTDMQEKPSNLHILSSFSCAKI